MSDSLAMSWAVAHQAPLSMGFLRQEYWSGLPFPSAGDLPDPGIKPKSPALAGRFFTTERPQEPLKHVKVSTGKHSCPQGSHCLCKDPGQSRLQAQGQDP